MYQLNRLLNLTTVLQSLPSRISLVSLFRVKEGYNEISALSASNTADSSQLCEGVAVIGTAIVLLTFGTLFLSPLPFFSHLLLKFYILYFPLHSNLF